MKLVDTDGSGHISYDEFISKMDVHLKQKQSVAGDDAHEILFHKLKALLDNQDKSLFEYMADFDYDNTGTIMTQDLVFVMKKVGLLRPEPYLQMILQAGNARETDERIDYTVFSQKLEEKITNSMSQSSQKQNLLVSKIAECLKSKKMSPFDFFTTLDVNQNCMITKIEFKTGMQSLGIDFNSAEFRYLWSMLKKPVKKMG